MSLKIFNRQTQLWEKLSTVEDINTHTSIKASQNTYGHVKIDNVTIIEDNEGRIKVSDNIVNGSGNSNISQQDIDKWNNHVNDNDTHVTSTEKDTWNNKADNTLATATKDGLMSKSDKMKLSSIESGANFTHIEDSLTSDAIDEALSAKQGKVLKDMIDNIQTNGNGSVWSTFEF